MTESIRHRPWYVLVIRLLAAAVALGFCAWFVFGDSGVWSSCRLQRQKALQAERIHRLELQKKELQAYLTALRTGDELAWERAAREQGLVAPNETIYEIRVEPAKN